MQSVSSIICYKALQDSVRFDTGRSKTGNNTSGSVFRNTFFAILHAPVALMFMNFTYKSITAQLITLQNLKLFFFCFISVCNTEKRFK